MNTTPQPSGPVPEPANATPTSRRGGSRGKVVAIATTAALAALTGIALNSNHGMPATPPAAPRSRTTDREHRPSRLHRVGPYGSGSLREAGASWAPAS